jgi:hypothetical protein
MTSMQERRQYPRCTAWLPLRLKAVQGIAEPEPINLLTQNFSKTGLCFPAPKWIEPGKSIEVEVTLLGAGPEGENMKIAGTGYVVRTEATNKPGWYTLAAVIQEPGRGEVRGWHDLADAFDDTPPSTTES